MKRADYDIPEWLPKVADEAMALADQRLQAAMLEHGEDFFHDGELWSLRVRQLHGLVAKEWSL